MTGRLYFVCCTCQDWTLTFTQGLQHEKRKHDVHLFQQVEGPPVFLAKLFVDKYKGTEI